MKHKEKQSLCKLYSEDWFNTWNKKNIMHKKQKKQITCWNGRSPKFGNALDMCALSTNLPFQKQLLFSEYQSVQSEKLIAKNSVLQKLIVKCLLWFCFPKEPNVKSTTQKKIIFWKNSPINEAIFLCKLKLQSNSVITNSWW